MRNAVELINKTWVEGPAILRVDRLDWYYTQYNEWNELFEQLLFESAEHRNMAHIIFRKKIK